MSTLHELIKYGSFFGGSNGAIKAPAVAKVGQTIAVNAVDENGRPVSWRAVDFPSGGGSAGSGGIWSTVAEFTYNQNTELTVDSYDEESKHLHFTTEHGLAVGDVLLLRTMSIRSSTVGYLTVTEVVDSQNVICADLVYLQTAELPQTVEKSAGRVLFWYKEKITKPYARLRIEGRTIFQSNKNWTFSAYNTSYGGDLLLGEAANNITNGMAVVQIVPAMYCGRLLGSRTSQSASHVAYVSDGYINNITYTPNYSPVPNEKVMTPQMVYNGLKIIVEEADTWEIP